jgi:hypothetical protein
VLWQGHPFFLDTNQTRRLCVSLSPYALTEGHSHSAPIRYT